MTTPQIDRIDEVDGKFVPHKPSSVLLGLDFNEETRDLVFWLMGVVSLPLLKFVTGESSETINAWLVKDADNPRPSLTNLVKLSVLGYLVRTLIERKYEEESIRAWLIGRFIDDETSVAEALFALSSSTDLSCDLRRLELSIEIFDE